MPFLTPPWISAGQRMFPLIARGLYVGGSPPPEHQCFIVLEDADLVDGPFIALETGGDNLIALQMCLPDPPNPIVAPVVTGDFVVGGIGISTQGTWEGTEPITFTIQWYRNNQGNPIFGAADYSYTFTDDDVGQNIYTDVTGTNTAGFADGFSNIVVPTASGDVVPVNTVAPHLGGGDAVGETGVVTPGTWTGSPVPSLSYQWQRNAADIVGQTGTTYVYTDDDESQDITVIETATNTVGSASETTNTVVPAAAPVGILIPDYDTLVATLHAGVAVNGGKAFLLPNGDFGGVSLIPFEEVYDFSTNPITISGQGSTELEWLTLAGCSGITWQDFNVYGVDTGTGSAITINNDLFPVSNSDFPSVMTFNRVTANSGTAEGTQAGGGWFFRANTAAVITVNGYGDDAIPDISGRVTAIDLYENFGDGTYTFNNLTEQNIGPDVNLIFGSKNVTLNALFATNSYWEDGDHPDFIQWAEAEGTPTTNLTITNCGYLQGIGKGSQGYFGEDGVNIVVQNSWWMSDIFPAGMANARGDTMLIDNNLIQGIVGPSAQIITRGGAVDTTATNNTTTAISNYAADGVNPGYVPDPLPGSNVIIDPVELGDFTNVDPWLVAHPTARRRPV